MLDDHSHYHSEFAVNLITEFYNTQFLCDVLQYNCHHSPRNCERTNSDQVFQQTIKLKDNVVYRDILLTYITRESTARRST